MTFDKSCKFSNTIGLLIKSLKSPVVATTAKFGLSATLFHVKSAGEKENCPLLGLYVKLPPLEAVETTTDKSVKEIPPPEPLIEEIVTVSLILSVIKLIFAPAINVNVLFADLATILFCCATEIVENKLGDDVAELITPLLIVMVVPSILTPPNTVVDAVGKI